MVPTCKFAKNYDFVQLRLVLMWWFFMLSIICVTDTKHKFQHGVYSLPRSAQFVEVVVKHDGFISAERCLLSNTYRRSKYRPSQYIICCGCSKFYHHCPNMCRRRIGKRCSALTSCLRTLTNSAINSLSPYCANSHPSPRLHINIMGNSTMLALALLMAVLPAAGTRRSYKVLRQSPSSR